MGAATVAGGIDRTGAAGGKTERSTLVREENAKPGTREWMLDTPRIEPSTKYCCPWIEGYCSHTSVRAGETISFHVKTDAVGES